MYNLNLGTKRQRVIFLIFIFQFVRHAAPRFWKGECFASVVRCASAEAARSRCHCGAKHGAKAPRQAAEKGCARLCFLCFVYVLFYLLYLRCVKLTSDLGFTQLPQQNGPRMSRQSLAVVSARHPMHSRSTRSFSLCIYSYISWGEGREKLNEAGR
jgi:hypothetical protein